MALRSKDIRCVGGECYAHVFENPKAGIRRGLFWNFILECVPITWDEDEWETSLSCDWVTLPGRSWRDLGQISLDDLPNRQMIETSFYLSAHHEVRLSRLEIAHDHQDQFRVQVGGRFDLEGYDDLDDMDISLDVSGLVQFKGLIVMPNNLFPKPSDIASAVTIAQEFVDLATFAEPVWDGSRYLFEPR